jgi:hypothetical protein
MSSFPYTSKLSLFKYLICTTDNPLFLIKIRKGKMLLYNQQTEKKKDGSSLTMSIVDGKITSDLVLYFE